MDYLERLNHVVYLQPRLEAPRAAVDSASGVEVNCKSPLINQRQGRLGSRSGATQTPDYFFYRGNPAVKVDNSRLKADVRALFITNALCGLNTKRPVRV